MRVSLQGRGWMLLGAIVLCAAVSGWAGGNALSRTMAALVILLSGVSAIGIGGSLTTDLRRFRALTQAVLDGDLSGRATGMDDTTR